MNEVSKESKADRFKALPFNHEMNKGDNVELNGEGKGLNPLNQRSN